MAALRRITDTIRHAEAPPGLLATSPGPRTKPAKGQDWEWMRQVRVQLYAAGTVRIWRGLAESMPKNWDDLSLARVEADELDTFDPPAPQAARDVLPYPLRIVSLPGERLQVGDRRMIRPAPGVRDVFDVFLIVKRADGAGKWRLEIGGTRPVHSVHIDQTWLDRWAARKNSVEPSRIMQVRLRCADLVSLPEITLEPHFDELLEEEKSDDAARWLDEHLMRGSLRTADRRIKVIEADENRFAAWIQARGARRAAPRHPQQATHHAPLTPHREQRVDAR